VSYGCERTRPWREDYINSRGMTYFAAVTTLLAIIAVGASLYGNRGRYEAIDFRYFYGWWTEVSNGVDPYRPLAKALPAEVPPDKLLRFCNNTPVFVLLFSPLSSLPQSAAFWLWQIVQLSCLILAVVLLVRELEPPLSAPVAVSVVSLILLFPPVHSGLHFARPTFMLVALLCASWVFDRRSRPAAAGLMLAAAALLKLYPAAVGGYFLFRRRPNVVIWAALFVLLGVILTGVGRWRELFVYGIPFINNVVSDGRAVSLMLSFKHLLRQLSGGSDHQGWWASAGALTAVVGVVLVARAGAVAARLPATTAVAGLYFGLWMLLALLLSPISWNNDLIFLVPAYLFAAIGYTRGCLPRRLPIALLALCALLQMTDFFFSGLRPFYLFPISLLVGFAAACSALSSAQVEADTAGEAVARSLEASRF